MATGNYLPPPPVLEINDPQAADKWKRFKRAWTNYALATELNKKSEAVQVATLLTVIGEEAREVFSTFGDWASEGDEAKIGPVLAKFESYCEPRKNVPFERYRFNRRIQEPGETYDQYRTALRKLAGGCEFATITPDEILRDRLVFGIRDAKVRERLLRESNLTLAKTDEICHAAESMAAQMKVVDGDHTMEVDAVGTSRDSPSKELQSPQDRRRIRECWNCGRKHDFYKKELCPAYGKTCNKCHKLNHFAAKCRGKGTEEPKKTPQAVQSIDGDEIFVVSAVNIDDSQCVTVKLESGNHIRFQADTGAQCNVLPIALYKKATMDVHLANVTPAHTKIRAYGGTTLPVVGTTLLQVWRGSRRCILDCKLVDNPGAQPLLGRKACLGMNIVSFLDNDHINPPNTGSAPVYSVDNTSPVSAQLLIQSYPMVFGPGIGLLEGTYHIRLDSSVEPVQHAPRRVPVPLRECLKETLDTLVQQDILAPVEQPTPWISSMVVVPKKDGTLRICLDPKDLNRAILREHYPLPTIEDIATRLHGAKVFTILDVSKGFWHIPLDEPSPFLTTFHTPFGRYRWKRMPFGICSAPEVFQRRMHELLEGLQGIEVVADDFVVVGFGETKESAVHDHDINLKAFLQRCEERGLKLNATKVQLRMSEVPFIGHVATPEGLCVDPAKVRAIKEMPAPKDVAAIQRLLGMVQYLSKFLPHLSDTTKPLRESTQKDVEWTWDHPQQQALDKLKQAVMSTPVLRYYSLNEEVTVQCDASQSGLGAALMQGGQPVAYASRALTSAETRYAQIEKELLAIVFACNRFDVYIYGRQMVQVETDHQPLELIVKKPLNNAPTRLQRMLLQLQRYSLNIRYKKGKYMFLADTLSRAHSAEVHSCETSPGLECIDHTSSLAIPKEKLQEIQHASRDDPVLMELRKMIMVGWPENKSEVPEILQIYFGYRDELTLQDQLVFKGQRLVIPAAIRKEMLALAHATHIGTEGCLRRAREIMFWPRMASELREYIAKCDVCLKYRDTPGKEPLQSHDVEPRPWAKVGADLCDLQGRTLLVSCDYFSNFIEVERITEVTTKGVSKAFKTMFARYGIPDILVTDNGPQFDSAEFDMFAKTWGFEHATSSPRYPQSNGKAENAVKTVKRLFKKCQETGQSEYLALLDWRNTPTEGVGTSPAQCFLGRRCKTRLPTKRSLLTSRFTTENDGQALDSQKRRQKYYYDRHAKELSRIGAGETVYMKLPGDSTWSSGVCTGLVGPRSYGVRVGNREFRRNRRQLLTPSGDHRPETDIPEPVPAAGTPREPKDDGSLPPEEVDQSESGNTGTGDSPNTEEQHAPRRSTRTRKTPLWYGDYVPS